MAALPTAVLCLLICLASFQTVLSAEPKPGELSGRVISQSPAATTVHLHTADGRELKASVDAEGHFHFRGVPAGNHLLQTYQMGLFFPDLRVEMTSKAGLVRASVSGMPKQPVSTPLFIRPIGEMHYYEKRKPVDVWSLIKSPYGIMIVISVFFIVVMPRLKIDPEELKEAQAALRGETGSSSQQPQQRIQGGGASR